MDSAREHKFGLRRSSIALMNPSLMREHHRKSAVFGELVWLFGPHGLRKVLKWFHDSPNSHIASASH